jgi:hypothetical protein
MMDDVRDERNDEIEVLLLKKRLCGYALDWWDKIQECNFSKGSQGIQHL